MFLQSLLELSNSSSSVRNFAPKFRRRPIKKFKKSLRRSLVLSQSGILISCCQVVLLARKPRGPEIFRPLQCYTRGGAAPRPPNSTPMCKTAGAFL